MIPDDEEFEGLKKALDVSNKISEVLELYLDGLDERQVMFCLSKSTFMVLCKFYLRNLNIDRKDLFVRLNIFLQIFKSSIDDTRKELEGY